MNQYCEEFFNEALIKELSPLTEQSWREADCAPDAEYDPDWEKYVTLNEMDLLRLFTVRSRSGQLLGYVTFFVSTTLHSRKTLQALHDSMFILKAHRKEGAARELLEFAEYELKNEGVQIMIMMVMCHRDYSSTLKLLGFNQTEMTFIKRLI